MQSMDRIEPRSAHRSGELKTLLFHHPVQAMTQNATLDLKNPSRPANPYVFHHEGSPGYAGNSPPFHGYNQPTVAHPNFYPSFPNQQGFVSVNNLLESGYLSPGPNCGYIESDTEASAHIDAAGFISFNFPFGMMVDIGPNQSVVVRNQRHQTVLFVSGCGNQVYVIHPQGRVMQLNRRIEVQTQQDHIMKTAKMWPRGISFTSNHSSLVYLVDPAGTRSTSDTFHNLYSRDIAQDAFARSLKNPKDMLISACAQELKSVQHWRLMNGTSCWSISGITIKQTTDGMVSIEHKIGDKLFLLRSSPNTGKILVQSGFLYMTASTGRQAHLYVRSLERRIHVNTDTFVIRNAGQSAGLDGNGKLRIY